MFYRFMSVIYVQKFSSKLMRKKITKKKLQADIKIYRF